MRTLRRLLSCLLILSLLLALIPFAGCGRGEPDTPETEGPSADAESPSGEGPAGDGFGGDAREEVLVPGPEDKVTSWEGDIGMPFINPYGERDRYADVAYEADGDVRFDWIDDTSRMTGQTFHGSIWTMTVDEVGETTDFLRRMKTHAFAKGMTNLLQPEDRLWSMQGTDGDGVRWWGQATYTAGSCQVTVVRERRLEAGHPLVIQTADFEAARVGFLLEHPGNRFLTLKVEFSQGSVSLDGERRSGYDAYTRDVRFQADVADVQGSAFLFDGLPQDPGYQAWDLSWEDENQPETITLTLYEVAPLSGVTVRETLGAIRVRNGTFGQVSVAPYLGDETYLDHPEYDESSLSGDVTPEGDAIFWLPPGYWDVLVQPAQEWLGTCRTCLVPVQAGRETIVTLPGSLQAAYAPRSLEPGDARGMEIVKAEARGAEAEIRFTLADPDTREVLPDLSNTTVLEGGEAGRLLRVERVATPPHVVLLLDSSGSMKGQMEKTVEAARTFVSGLPDNAVVQVVDFDTEPRLVKGNTKAEALAGLKAVKANGATALYDSVVLGLELLAGKDRPTLVVFTDGQDANLDDSGPGSTATRESALEAIDAAGVPVYAIGFGKGHDSATMDLLARRSGGRYFAAEDQQALAAVFAAIGAKLGNTFRAVYARPEKDTAGDTPVISVVLDSSGSMDMDPSTEGCGYRIHRVKNLFHDFLLGLPEGTLAQVTSFDDDVRVTQMLTANKAELLAGLNLVDAYGGTEIHQAVDSAYETLKAVPSSRKAIVFLTDAALDVTEKDDFHRLLGRIREDGIRILWAGVGLDGEEAVFAETAALSGGSYVITEDTAALGAALDRLMAEVKAMPASAETAIRLLVNKRTPTGEVHAYSAAAMAPFDPPPAAREKTEPETVKVADGKTFAQYEPETAALVYGTDVPAADVKVVKRIPLAVRGQNQALAWTLEEAVVLERLRGLDAPSGMRFLGLHATFENILPEQEVMVYPDGSGHPAQWVGSGAASGVKKKVRIPYLIPDLSSHIFLQVNNAGQTPVSPVTWLAETPLVSPGEMALRVEPDTPVEGMLLFVVPDGALDQLSLHLYDTDYGHIATALTGVMARQAAAVSALPKTVEGRLSDAFSVSIGAWTAQPAVGAVQAGAGSAFRILEGGFTSRVQALMELDPSERFRLRIPTEKGDFFLPTHPATVLLPFGFYRPTVLAPGAKNTFRMAFQMPDILAGLAPQLHADLKDSDVAVTIAGTPKASVRTKGAHAGDGMSLDVNGVYRAESVAGESGDWIVADLTVYDTKDGLATEGVAGTMVLVAGAGDTGSGDGDAGSGDGDAGSDSDGTPEILDTAPQTDAMLLGFGAGAVVPDGAQRRGFVAFLLESDAAEWVLKSSSFPTLSQPAGAAVLDAGWTVPAVEAEVEDDWQNACAAVLGEAVREHEAYLAAHPPQVAPVAAGDLTGTKTAAGRVPVPSLTVYGQDRFDRVKTLDELQTLLGTVTWIPDGRTWLAGYDPASVLTQGWGTEGDLARMAEQGLAKLGYRPRQRTVNLTDQGVRALETASGVTGLAGVNRLPALSWLGSDGKEKLLVVPFLRDLSELPGQVWLPGGSGFEDRHDVRAVGIRVYARAISQDKTVGSQFGSMADALGGEGESEPEPEDVLLLETEEDIASLGRDAVDLGFVVAGQGKGEVLAAYLDGFTGLRAGQHPIDTGRFKVVGFKTVVTPPNGRESFHQYALAEGESLKDVFVTYGIGLPDLPKDAAAALEQAADQAHRAAAKADDLSALRWYTRSILNRFVAGQTAFERDTAAQLGVVAGRTETPRSLAITVHRTTGKVRTGIDLLQSVSDVHGDDPALQTAAQAFRSAAGFAATALETSVLPGDGLGLFEIWERLPKGTDYVFLSPEARVEAEADFLAAGMSEAVADRLLQPENDVWVLIPDKPARIGGRDRWAWLEMKENGETIGVLDTGAHGGMVEVSIQEWVSEANLYIVGGLVGINASIWSVSAFSLELDDYGQILAKAKAYAMGIKDAFEFKAGPAGYSVGGLPEISGSAYGIKGTLGTGGITLGQDLLGFANGYADGVAYYFSKAK